MFQFYAAAALVLQLALVGAQSSGVLTSDTYFYGDSPKVAPPRTGSGTGNWTESYTKAKAFVAKLTLDEKLNLTAGAPAPVGCTGFVFRDPRVGFDRRPTNLTFAAMSLRCRASAFPACV